MRKIGLRIKEARQAKKLNQIELAALLEVSSYSVVSKWELGKAKPDCETLKRLCEILDVSPEYILDYKNAIKNTPSFDEQVLLEKYRDIDIFGKNAVNAVLDAEYARLFSVRSKNKKPRLLSVDFFNFAASAGLGNFLETEKPEEIWVKETPEAERADFIIPIAGDSMEPEFHNGDKVFVEKCSSIAIGEIGIFIVNCESYIKQLGEGCLLSLNEAYKPIKLSEDDSVYCCGRVLGVVEE